MNNYIEVLEKASTIIAGLDFDRVSEEIDRYNNNRDIHRPIFQSMVTLLNGKYLQPEIWEDGSSRVVVKGLGSDEVLIEVPVITKSGTSPLMDIIREGGFAAALPYEYEKELAGVFKEKLGVHEGFYRHLTGPVARELEVESDLYAADFVIALMKSMAKQVIPHAIAKRVYAPMWNQLMVEGMVTEREAIHSTRLAVWDTDNLKRVTTLRTNCKVGCFTHRMAEFLELPVLTRYSFD